MKIAISRIAGTAFTALVALAPLVVLAQQPGETAASRQPAAPIVIRPAEKAAAGAISAYGMRSTIRFLASDLLEGRGPATPGDRLAQAYIASRFEALGLLPGAPNGSFFQPVEMVGVTGRVPPSVAFSRGGEKLDLRVTDDVVAFSGVASSEARLEDAEVVFVGYGIVAPEYQWDDYKGRDLQGKVLLMMNNDPESDPGLFAGKTRLYYGRWDYKYEMAAKLGAAGAIIIHTDHSAGYKWQVVQSSWSGEQFSLPGGSGPALQVKAWMTQDASRRLARLAGQDLDALRAAAEDRRFAPVPLGVRVSLRLENAISRKQTANVIARLPGRDPALAQEAVIYTAHHDHLGKGDGPGDAIHNGALDNASGVAAMLEVAAAFQALAQKPRRSVYFAAVAAEEQGLLGSQSLAENPPLPPGRIAANINIDGLNIWGPTRDITMIGLGKSNLDDWVRALLAVDGRQVVADQFPDKGSFYRSDQFSLAKIGVPAAYFDSGTDVVGKPPGWGRKAQQDFEDAHYHQPSDELRDDWNFEGALQDTRFQFYLGLRVANAARMPSWKPGDEFEAARKKALAEVDAANRAAGAQTR